MITPMTSMQMPLRMAQTVRAMTLPTLIALQTFGWFWTAWAEVYRPSGKPGKY